MDLLTLINQVEKLFDLYGLIVVFFSSFIEMSPIGWLIPGGLVVALAGFFSYGEEGAFIKVLLTGWAGSWLTFVLAYLLGKKTGFSLVKIFKQEKAAEKSKVLLEKHGGVILTTSMLAGLTRFWIAYVAGNQGYNPLRFLFFSLASSLTWTSLQVTVGYLAGSERSNLERGVAALGIASWIFLALAMLAIYWANKREFKHAHGKNDNSRN